MTRHCAATHGYYIFFCDTLKCVKQGAITIKCTFFSLQHHVTFCNYLWSFPTQSGSSKEFDKLFLMPSFWKRNDWTVFKKCEADEQLNGPFFFFNLFFSSLSLQQVRFTARRERDANKQAAKAYREHQRVSLSPLHKMERKSESWHGDGCTRILHAVRQPSDVSTLPGRERKKYVRLLASDLCYYTLRLC